MPGGSVVPVACCLCLLLRCLHFQLQLAVVLEGYSRLCMLDSKMHSLAGGHRSAEGYPPSAPKLAARCRGRPAAPERKARLGFLLGEQRLCLVNNDCATSAWFP